MLKQLQYEVTFPSTGRTLSENIEFQKGFGAVVGMNGAGKSSVIEFLRWMLYGSAALRGKADDYKTLKGKLDLSIRGVDYTIERTRSKATLSCGDELIASGTTPVNQKVAALMGFGLTVFDVACIANQGDIEKLGSMRPTERRQMVDSVIGLGIIDDLTKWAGDEALSLKREASTLAENLVKPVEPSKPAGYCSVEALKAVIEEKRQFQRQVITLEATPPAGPRPTNLSLIELKERAAVLPLVAELKAMPPASTWTEADLDEQDALHEAPKWQGVDQPKYSRAVLEQWLKDHDQVEVNDARASLERQIARLRSGETTCPSCNHRWTEDDDKLRQLEHELSQLRGYVDVSSKPGLSREGITKMLAHWDDYDNQPPKPEVVPPRLSRAQIAAERHKIALNDRRETLMQATKDYDGTDYNRLIFQLETWERASEAWDEAQKALQALRPRASDLPELEQLLQQCLIYDQLLAQFNKQKETYDTQSERVAELRQQADDWAKVKVALTELRLKIKQHLVPSLNRVSSHFIKQMTGGIKQEIVVDEDFDILVDNQAINTLSGSEKAVANLALRLALGQVLTNNVFPVFIGDEIDASMDQDRARQTTELLRSLTQRLSQVLLVTHKYPEADYHIQIGDTCDRLDVSAEG